ncbi:methionyl-tRNA formyltransferase [Dissulfurirhabdus thermomarina]|uniref:Methionyl-tRNA formyltransferase n=2 Tax=Dissulfurirhabdus thermomarina TaxID=1765737 RepID=A0A6N9TNJ7_DISTH|nr:methionyl-tRNA formyltransferase [Dissulfurirhabdus thermomarina]NMX24015.1 methionyl-tRNA formyltransferase [Dissulfurirhabdus thermomarina]
MGTPEFAVPSLEALLRRGHRVAAVVTQPDRPRGRGRAPRPSPVKEAATRAGIEVLQPESVRDPAFIARVRELAPDFLVVAAYGQILPEALLAVPRRHPVNVHASLLPAYRGAAPIQWAILNGETETGITLMVMDRGMDTGPVLLQRALEIGPDETFGELLPRMARLGAEVLVEGLDRLAAGEIQPMPQPGEGISLAPPIRPEMARVDWHTPAARLAGLLRALDPRPGAYTTWAGERLRLFRPFLPGGPAPTAPPGTVLSAGADGLVVAAADAPLGIRELQRPGGRRLPVADFLRGRPLAPGTRLSP